MAEKTLKEQTVSGFSWSAIENLIRASISFFVGLILARMLSPEEYGLVGILLIFIAIFNTIVDSGFASALIRKKNVTDLDYSTVFYTNAVLSTFLAVVLFFSARPIALFFNQPKLILLTQVMSSIIVINGLAIVQRVKMTKAIDFRTQAKITFISVVISGVIGIVMAYLGYGVWALVCQQLTNQAFSTILFWLFNRWTPKWLFSWTTFKQLWSFSSKLLASSLIATIWNEIYQVIIGKYYCPATLGLFTRAKQFSDLFSSNLTTVVQRVSFPVLSSMQEDKQRLKSSYRKLIKTIMLPVFVLMLGMISCAEPIIKVLLGEQWLGCVSMLQIINLYGMLYPLHALNLNMLQVQGRSDLFLKLEIIKKIVAVGPLCLGIFVGIYWMLIGSVLTGFFAYYLNAYYSGPFLNYSITEQVKDILPSFGVAFTMAAAVYAISFIPLMPVVLLTTQVIAGAAITIGLCELFKLEEYKEIKSLAFSMINKIRNRW